MKDELKAGTDFGCGMPKTVPEKEHLWLRQLAGEWDCDTEMTMGPDQPPMKSKGSDSTRMIGDCWSVTEIKGMPPGMTDPMTGLLTIGYDPSRKRFTGTWIDSMTNFMWKYDGALDASGKVLTLETEGPNMMTPGKTSPYRESLELRDANQKVFTSSMKLDDGAWATFMTSRAKRRK